MASYGWGDPPDDKRIPPEMEAQFRKWAIDKFGKDYPNLAGWFDVGVQRMKDQIRSEAYDGCDDDEGPRSARGSGYSYAPRRQNTERQQA